MLRRGRRGGVKDEEDRGCEKGRMKKENEKEGESFQEGRLREKS